MANNTYKIDAFLTISLTAILLSLNATFSSSEADFARSIVRSVVTACLTQLDILSQREIVR